MAGRGWSNRRSQNGGGHLPPPWLSGWFDPELKELFEDEPDLYGTAHLLRSSRPEAQADLQYRQRLRASLMAEAEGSLGRHRLRRWFVPGPGHLAWGGAAAGVALIAATALAVFSGRVQDHQTIMAYSRLTAQHAVSPNDVITVAFNQPMDHQAVVAGLNIKPATQVTTAWPSRIRSTACATLSGSSGDRGSGWRVSTWQKPHARVHRSPLIMKVAVPSAQHS